MSVSKSLSPRGWFIGGLLAAAVLIALAIPEASAQPSLVDSSVRIELFFPNLTSPTIYRDYGVLPVVAGAPELVSPVGDDEFCGTCTIDIEASSIDVTFAQFRPIACCNAAFNGFVFTLPQNFTVLSATLTPPPGGNATVSWTGNILRINFGPVPGGANIQAGDNFHIALVLEKAVDPPGSGALRLTSTGGQRSGLLYSASVPTNQGLVVTFKQYQYGAVVVPGDGIAFVLAATPPQPGFIGAGGGDLGYIGMPGGWLGIGFDVFGNFTNNDFSGSGCTDETWGTAPPNEVTVRGPGNPGSLGNVGYCLRSSSADGSLDDPLGPFGIQLNGVDRASSLRSVAIVIDPVETNTYSVAIDPLGGTNYTLVTSGPLPSSYYDPSGNPVSGIPLNVTFGWTATTGLADDIHEITDVVVKNLDNVVLLSDAFTGATTTAPVFGLPPGTGFPCLTAGTDPAATPVPGCAPVAGGFTTTVAQSVPDVLVPLGGGIVTLGNIDIVESQAGVISTGALIDIMLEGGLTFSGSPSFSDLNGTGLTVVGVGCIDACTGFTFQITAKSTGGPARIRISNISVVVPSGPVPPFGFCDTDTGRPGIPVCVSLNRHTEILNGFSSSGQLVIASLIPASQPTLTSMSVNAVGEGATTTVILFGQNLSQLDFSPGHDTISFGDGITVVAGSIVVSADGTKITLKIKVDPTAPLGFHDVTITHPGIGPIVLDDQLKVNVAPTVTSAGTGADGAGPLLSPLTDGLLKGQTLIIKGTGFQAPTAAPSNLVVSLGGIGVTVNSVGYTSDTQLSVNVDVTAGAQAASPRTVTVTNPDLGTGTTSGAVLFVQAAPADAPVGLNPTAISGTVTLPPTPQVTKITPTSGPTGFAPVTITGKNFSATAANNLVTFTTANGLRVVATITSATSSTLKVVVPAAAVDGPVIVAVSGVQQSGTPFNFTVTNPTLSAVTVPDGPAKRSGAQVHVHLIGSKFQPNAKVAFNPPTNLTLGSLSITATDITVPVTVGAGAALGLRDVTVTNPDGASATLPQSFAVNGQFNLALSLTTLGGVSIPSATVDFPSVDSVQVTLDARGTCTARTITPTVYLFTASFPGARPTTLPPLTFIASSSAFAGTATNDDCEPNQAQVPAPPPEKDFSIGPVDQPPDVASQRITVSPVNGVYRVWLASWDWGGTVHIDVLDNPANPATATVGTGITLPVGSIPFGPAMSAVDGLTDFHKRRGVYLVAPNKGNTGQLQSHVRLDVGMRNLFVRGLGFSTDPTLNPNAGDNNCGLNSITGAKVPADPAIPCPKFQIGDAFVTAGVKVWDVSSSFNPAGTTVFPTQSLADSTKPMLHLANVKYDVVNCTGGAPCDNTSKLGPRQWNFPTLGFSTFGSATTYGTALVLGKSFKAYFLDRPYKHQENVPGAFLPAPVGEKPMLAPITKVCDRASAGSDDGTAQSGECSVGGLPGGDVYQPGQFRLDMTAMDVNNDGCVELPFVADPTTLTPCNQSSNSASAPQATFQQAVRHVITHELGHAVGINIHTSVATDVMYMYSINWARADLATNGSFSSQSGALIQIHNTGQPTVQP
jgi:hypothetical protein